MKKTGQTTTAGKPVYKKDGELISEKTIGIEFDGIEYTIPTVYKGKVVSYEEAIQLFKDGKIKAVATSKSPEEGDKKAQERSKSLLPKKSGGKVYTRKAMHYEI